MEHVHTIRLVSAEHVHSRGSCIDRESVASWVAISLCDWSPFASGNGGVAAKDGVLLLIEVACLQHCLRVTVGLPWLLVRLPQLLDFSITLLRVPFMLILLHATSSQPTGLEVPTAGVKLWLHSVLSPYSYAVAGQVLFRHCLRLVRFHCK